MCTRPWTEIEDEVGYNAGLHLRGRQHIQSRYSLLEKWRQDL